MEIGVDEASGLRDRADQRSINIPYVVRVTHISFYHMKHGNPSHTCLSPTHDMLDTLTTHVSSIGLFASIPAPAVLSSSFSPCGSALAIICNSFRAVVYITCSMRDRLRCITPLFVSIEDLYGVSI